MTHLTITYTDDTPSATHDIAKVIVTENPKHLLVLHTNLSGKLVLTCSSEIVNNADDLVSITPCRVTDIDWSLMIETKTAGTRIIPLQRMTEMFIPNPKLQVSIISAPEEDLACSLQAAASFIGDLKKVASMEFGIPQAPPMMQELLAL